MAFRSTTVPRVAYLVKWVERALRLRLDEALAPSGMSTPEYTALSVLRERDGLSSAQLARRVGVTPQAMNQIVIGLEARALISRGNAAQGRKMGTSLTPKGTDQLALGDRATLPVEERLLAGLSPADVARLRRALSSCVDSLGGRDARGRDSGEGPVRARRGKGGGRSIRPLD